MRNSISLEYSKRKMSICSRRTDGWEYIRCRWCLVICFSNFYEISFRYLSWQSIRFRYFRFSFNFLLPLLLLLVVVHFKAKLRAHRDHWTHCGNGADREYVVLGERHKTSPISLVSHDDRTDSGLTFDGMSFLQFVWLVCFCDFECEQIVLMWLPNAPNKRE